jgi:hypothetical protein
MQSDEEREFFFPSFWGKEKKIGFCPGLGCLLPLLGYLQQSLELQALPDRLEIRVIEEGTLPSFSGKLSLAASAAWRASP